MIDRRQFIKRVSALLATCAIYRPAAAAADELLERENLDAKERILELPCQPDPWLLSVIKLKAGGPIDLGDFIAIDPRGRAIRATEATQVVGVALKCERQTVFVRLSGNLPGGAG
jgi:hypothetical protein